MIAAWMLHAAAAALCLGIAAMAGERLLRLTGRASRWPWAVAMLGSLVLPLLRLLLPAATGATAAVEPGAGVGAPIGADAWAALLARADVVVAADSIWQQLDRPLGIAWLACSLLVASWLLVGAARLRRLRREWRSAEVQGTPVLLSGRTGPALVGVLHPRVVLPEWALGAPSAQLDLMLAHEQEHGRARDPLLLLAAALAAAVMPWNIAIWWQLHRLRLAVEVDCDRRVLRRYPDVRRYGALLLAVGRQLDADGGRPWLPQAALGLPTTTLERRIRTMTMPRPEHPRLQAAALAALSGALLLAACEVPRPTEIEPAREIPLASIRTEGTYTPSQRIGVTRVRAVLRDSAPDVLSAPAAGGRVDVWIVAESDGTVRQATVGRSPAAARPVGQPAGALYRMRGPSVAPERIASIEVLKLAPGKLLADSAGVIWVTLKPAGEITEVPSTSTEREVVGRAAARTTEREVVGRVAARTREQPAGRSYFRRSAPDSAPRVVLRSVGGGVVTDSPRLVASRSMRLEMPADSAQPLWVIDGVVTTGDAVKKLLPDRIASINVLKGEAALKAYGQRGVNGVVEVVTK